MDTLVESPNVNSPMPIESPEGSDRGELNGDEMVNGMPSEGGVNGTSEDGGDTMTEGTENTTTSEGGVNTTTSEGGVPPGETPMTVPNTTGTGDSPVNEGPRKRGRPKKFDSGLTQQGPVTRGSKVNPGGLSTRSGQRGLPARLNQRGTSTRSGGLKPRQPVATTNTTTYTKRKSTKKAPLTGGSKVSTKSKSKSKRRKLSGAAAGGTGTDGGDNVTQNVKVPNLQKKLSLVKYGARLAGMPDSDFECLNNHYISVYEPSLPKNKLSNVTSCARWINVLNEVASKKGCMIKGVLPHYGKTIKDTDLKLYNCSPDIVDYDKVDQYHQAGYNNAVGERVYVGCSKAPKCPPVTALAFCNTDKKADEFWKAVQKELMPQD